MKIINFYNYLYFRSCLYSQWIKTLPGCGNSGSIIVERTFFLISCVMTANLMSLLMLFIILCKSLLPHWLILSSHTIGLMTCIIVAIISLLYYDEGLYHELKNKYGKEKHSKVKGLLVRIYIYSSIILFFWLFGNYNSFVFVL